MPLIFCKGEKSLQRRHDIYVKEMTKCGLDLELVFAKHDGVLTFLSAFINIVILTFVGIKKDMNTIIRMGSLTKLAKLLKRYSITQSMICFGVEILEHL